METERSITLNAPVSDTSLLTTREQIILLQGSKLHGCVFPPWKAAPDSSEFVAPFTDETYFGFSGDQLDILKGWRSPEEVLPCPVMVSDGKVDLVQDVTSDCSVVASLCTESAREERGHGKSIIFPIMYPSVVSRPTLSANGKYIFKFHFNGCFRKVVVDHRLPASRSSRALHVVDRKNPGLLWPALVEKAYLKVRGGYDFPGSNSGTDLWVLTGWIPEQIFLKSDDVVPNALWKRIHNAFNYGDVLVTMGTGKLAREEEEGLGLIGEHDYAVLDMKEEAGQRVFLIKNPWSQGDVWNASVVREEAPAGGTGNADVKADPLSPGTFWMDLNNVYANFETIYLNWNLGLFSFRRDIHFTWDLSTKRSPSGSFDRNPQYMVRSSAGGTLWLLLNKHFQNATKEEVGKRERRALASDRRKSGYISLYAFDVGGCRVSLTDGSVIRSPYVDAPNNLLRLELPARSPYTFVVSEQDLPSASYNFTLSAFSTNPLTVSQATERYGFTTVDNGAWTCATAGGNASSRSYHTNPQYSLQLSKTSDLTLLLEATTEEYHVHVKLIWAGGKRIQPHITTRDIVGDSGDYRRGCALADLRGVLPGTYTVVCSTFAPQQRGQYTLRVRSASPVGLAPIPLESGRFALKLPPASFVGGGGDRVLAPLQVTRITRLHFKARCRPSSTSSSSSSSSSPPRSPLRVAVELGQGPDKQVLACSGKGEFVDAPGGLSTDDIDVLPKMCEPGAGGLWIVVERVGGSCVSGREEVEIEVLSAEDGVYVGAWGTEME